MRIDGTSFVLDSIKDFSFEQFKENFRHSYAAGKSDEDMQPVYDQLMEAAKPVNELPEMKVADTDKSTDDGNSANDKEATPAATGKGRGTGKGSAK